MHHLCNPVLEKQEQLSCQSRISSLFRIHSLPTAAKAQFLVDNFSDTPTTFSKSCTVCCIHAFIACMLF